MDKDLVNAMGKFGNSKAESLIINSVGQRPTRRYAYAIAKPQRGVIGMSPFQGLNWLGDLFRRALPYANDFTPFRGGTKTIFTSNPSRCHWAELSTAYSRLREKVSCRNFRLDTPFWATQQSLREEANTDNPVQTQCSTGYVSLLPTELRSSSTPTELYFSGSFHPALRLSPCTGLSIFKSFGLAVAMTIIGGKSRENADNQCNVIVSSPMTQFKTPLAPIYNRCGGWVARVTNSRERISPFQGLNWSGDLSRRALPYAIDGRAFSPFRPFAPSCLRPFALSPFQGLNWSGDLFRRALPYANEDRAFSPFRAFAPSRLRAFVLSRLHAFVPSPFCIRSRRFIASVAQPLKGVKSIAQGIALRKLRHSINQAESL